MSTDSAEPVGEAKFSRHDFLRLIVAGATAGFVVPAVTASSASADTVPPVLNPPPGGEPPIIQGPTSVSSGSLTSSASSTSSTTSSSTTSSSTTSSSVTSSTTSSGSTPPPGAITFTPVVADENGAAMPVQHVPAATTLRLPSLRSLW